jgi:hypothetical protein
MPRRGGCQAARSPLTQKGLRGPGTLTQLRVGRNRERPLEMAFGFCGIRLWRHQGDFAGDATSLGLKRPTP